MIPLFDIRAVNAIAEKMAAGDPAAFHRSLDLMLGQYRAVFRAGASLLRRNYSVSAEECERLMPFNFATSDAGDPGSIVGRATQRE
jgi:hypothetical protein